MLDDVIALEDGYENEPDCAVVALAVYLKKPYADVIRARMSIRTVPKSGGLTLNGIKRVAKLLGFTLRRRQMDHVNGHGHGIICAPEHAAVLLNGCVIDRLKIYPLKKWMKEYRIEKKCDCDFFVAVKK